MVQVVLGLGSNHTRKLDFLRRSLLELQSIEGIQVLKASPFYQSDALLPPNAPPSWDQPYLNAALLIETCLDPFQLLRTVKSIEEKLGRKDRGRWAPREIDIDLLAYGETIVDAPGLQIPHIGLTERPFAALPFSDLWPSWTHPKGLFTETIENFVSPWRMESPFQTKRSFESWSQFVKILNLTPKSFSDDSPRSVEDTLQELHTLKDLGLSILDLGGEATHPHAPSVDESEEWRRLEPFLKTIRREFPDLTLSVDTRRAFVAERAIEQGADWINDVEGLSNPNMQRIARLSDIPFIIMHQLSVPANPSVVLDKAQDPMTQIVNWATQKVRSLEELGIARERLILDPGLGFGKTQIQSWILLREIQKLNALKRPVFVGHSRKSFLKSITDMPASERDLETVSISLGLVQKGIQFIRIHSLQAHFRALKPWILTDGITRWTTETR